LLPSLREDFAKLKRYLDELNRESAPPLSQPPPPTAKAQKAQMDLF
jgi:hypothetical protein